MVLSSLSLLRRRAGRLIDDRASRLWNTSLSLSSMSPLLLFLTLSTKLYEKGLAHRQRGARLQKQRLPAFVISVGNLVVGGTGKTPLVLWLARFLSRNGRLTAVLSRGYGRKAKGVDRVAFQGESRSHVLRFGDEPVLMARRLPDVPVWVGKERRLAGQQAIEASGATILLLDDGFQHVSLHRDLDLVLLDAHRPFGNGSLLPLGPLREPPQHLERADAFILTRAQDREKTLQTRSLLSERFPGKPVFSCRHRLTGFRVGLDGPTVPLEALQKGQAVAFAGIAHPDTFFHALQRSGIALCDCLVFPDHHFYEAGDVDQWTARVRKSGAQFLITTEKDIVRLPLELQGIVLSAKVELDFGAEREIFSTYLERHLP